MAQQTAKEKAQELIDRFSEYSHTDFNYSRGGYQANTQIQNAKQCALIAVDEIISSREDDGAFDDTLSSMSSEYYTPHPMYLTFWLQVKQEIEKL